MPKQRFTAEDVRSVLAGDQQAVEAFFCKLTPFIRGAVRSLLHGQRGADWDQDDVVQAVTLDVCKENFGRLRQWDDKAGLSIESFLYRLTFWHTRSFLRRARRVEVAPQPTSTSPDLAKDSDLGSSLAQALLDATPSGQLSPEALFEIREYVSHLRANSEPEDFKLFWLKYAEEYQTKEISRILGLNDGADALESERVASMLDKRLSRIRHSFLNILIKAFRPKTTEPVDDRRQIFER